MIHNHHEHILHKIVLQLKTYANYDSDSAIFTPCYSPSIEDHKIEL